MLVFLGVIWKKEKHLDVLKLQAVFFQIYFTLPETNKSPRKKDGLDGWKMSFHLGQTAYFQGIYLGLGVGHDVGQEMCFGNVSNTKSTFEFLDFQENIGWISSQPLILTSCPTPHQNLLVWIFFHEFFFLRRCYECVA